MFFVVFFLSLWSLCLIFLMYLLFRVVKWLEGQKLLQEVMTSSLSSVVKNAESEVSSSKKKPVTGMSDEEFERIREKLDTNKANKNASKESIIISSMDGLGKETIMEGDSPETITKLRNITNGKKI